MRWLRRSVLRTDFPALLASGSRGETRYARFASSARTVAASQKYEARFARRPRGCAARRRRHRIAPRSPLSRRPGAARPARRARPGPDPLPPAALATSKVLGRTAGTLASRTTTVHADARAATLARAQGNTAAAARGASSWRACAQPRSAAVPARARSALRTSDSPRLFERSSRSEHSEFRGGAGGASIAGHPREAGASTGTPWGSALRRCGRIRLRPCERCGPRICTRICTHEPSARRALESLK